MDACRLRVARGSFRLWRDRNAAAHVSEGPE